MTDYDLTGMGADDAKAYMLNFATNLKMTEKEIITLEAEAAKWNSRIDLARSKGMEDILAEAEKEADNANARLASLREEAESLKNGIASMRGQLPGLAARERSIDPDLLEQELLMALGKTGEEAATEKAFKNLEKESAADAALEVLKAKMKGDATPE